MRTVKVTAYAVVVIAVLVVVAYVVGVRTYGIPGQTLNGGVTLGRCGVEVWGIPGTFCDVD